MNQNSAWRPAIAAERIKIIDVLRGLALFGVLIVNILTGFRVPLLEHIREPYAHLNRADRIVELLTAGVLEFKALTIFSFLFGVGIAIQVQRSARKSFLVRRMLFLFLLGLIHMFLIWNGDILTLYAICGLLLIPCVDLPCLPLFLIGAALIAFPEFVSFGLPWPSGPAATADIARAHVYATQGYFAILQFRWYEAWSLIVPILISVLPRTIGLMYWGMAAWRAGILATPGRYRKKLLAALVIGATIGGALTLNEVWGKYSGRIPWPALQGTHIDASILLAVAYVSGVLLWLDPRRAPGLAALGQMALTNYLLQSIVLGFIFYGYGFGLFGRIGSAAAALIGVILYFLQVQLSRVWLHHFRFGPFEWLWRSLAYARRQPMRGALLSLERQ